jgi:hypothetical protein
MGLCTNRVQGNAGAQGMASQAANVILCINHSEWVAGAVKANTKFIASYNRNDRTAAQATNICTKSFPNPAITQLEAVRIS